MNRQQCVVSVTRVRFFMKTAFFQELRARDAKLEKLQTL
jgi:hypothetical protein